MKEKYILNVKTKMIHFEKCFQAKRIKSENRLVFFTVEEAEAKCKNEYSSKMYYCNRCFEKIKEDIKNEKK